MRTTLTVCLTRPLCLQNFGGSDSFGDGDDDEDDDDDMPSLAPQR